MLIAEVTTLVPTHLNQPGTAPSRCGPVKIIAIFITKMALDAWLEFVLMDPIWLFIETVILIR